MSKQDLEAAFRRQDRAKRAKAIMANNEESGKMSGKNDPNMYDGGKGQTEHAARTKEAAKSSAKETVGTVSKILGSMTQVGAALAAYAPGDAGKDSDKIPASERGAEKRPQPKKEAPVQVAKKEAVPAPKKEVAADPEANMSGQDYYDRGIKKMDAGDREGGTRDIEMSASERIFDRDRYKESSSKFAQAVASKKKKVQKNAGK